MAAAKPSVGGMVRRKKYRPKGPLYPEHWEVATSWKHGRTVLESRQHDIQIKGERGWFTFDRVVKNTRTGSEWVDCFYQHPYGGFASYSLDRVTRVRKHVDTKPKRDPRIDQAEEDRKALLASARARRS